MEIVNPDHRLHGAGMCFLCEKAIDHPKEKAIRTGHEYDPMFQSPLVGDKYVCQSCAETLALTLGWATPEVVELAKADAAFNELRFRQLVELAGQIANPSELPALNPVAVTATKEKVSGSKA